MSIPQAVISPVARGILSLTSQMSWESTPLVGLSSLEAGFYGVLKATNEQGNKTIRWIREETVSRVHEIQLIFNIANTGAALFHAKKLLEEIQKSTSYSFIDLSPDVSKGGVFVPAMLLGGTLFTAYRVGKFTLDRLGFVSTSTSRQVNDSVKLKEKMTHSQNFARGLHVTKLVLQCALLFLAKERLALGVALAGTLYSFRKNMQMKWLRFSCVIRFHPPIVTYWQFAMNGMVRYVIMTYRMLALPAKRTTATERCSSCQQVLTEAAAKIAFCGRHIMHQSCIERDIASQPGQFLQDAVYIKYLRRQSHNRFKWEYRVVIPERDLPACPVCAFRPPQNYCHVKLLDHVDRDLYMTNVDVISDDNSQHVFELLNMGYNAIQAALTHLHIYPELATLLFKVQKIMIPCDILTLWMTGYYLYQNVKREFLFLPQNQQAQTLEQIQALISEYERRHMLFNIAVVITAIATAALSMIVALVLCSQNFYSLGCVKAPGLRDRKQVHIELILTCLRSLNRGSFHVSPKSKNFVNRVLGLKAYLKPGYVLKSLLGQLPPDFGAFKNATLDWSAPWTHTLMQSLYINRILATLALSFFSTLKGANYFCIAMQLKSLRGISNLHLNRIKLLWDRDPFSCFKIQQKRV